MPFYCKGYSITDLWQHYLCNFTSLKEGEDQKEITIEPAQALDEVEPLPEDCYTRPISLPEGTFLSYMNYASKLPLSLRLSLM